MDTADGKFSIFFYWVTAFPGAHLYQREYRIPFLYIKQTKGENLSKPQQTTDSFIINLLGEKWKHLALFSFKYTSMND